MRYYLVLGLIGFATLMSLIGFQHSVSLYLWNNIFRPLDFARMGGAFPVAKYVLYVMVASFFIQLVRGQLKIQINFFVIFVFVFLGWGVISALHSPYPATSWPGLSEISKYLLPLILVSAGLNSKAAVRQVALVMTLSVGVWSTQAGIHGLIKGVSRDMSIPGGQMTDNNDFMAATVSILPMLVFFWTGYAGRFRKAIKSMGLVMTLLSICAIIFSNSRGAALGLVGTILIFIIMVSKKKWKHSLIFLTVTAIGLSLLPQTFWDRMQTIELSAEQTEGSAASRMQIMVSAWKCLIDNPIFGVGPDSWLSASPFYAGRVLEPHNLWLKLGTELGFTGIFLYLLIASYTMWRLLQLSREALAAGDKDGSALASALIMSIIGFLMPSTFLSHPFSEFLWAWYAISHAFIYSCSGKYPAGKVRRAA